MFSKSNSTVYRDEEGNYLTAVDLHSLVRTGTLSNLSETSEGGKKAVDEDGVSHEFERVADSPDDVAEYDPSESSYINQVGWA